VGAINITPAISIAADHFTDKTRHKKYFFVLIFILDTNSRTFDEIIVKKVPILRKNNFAGNAFSPILKAGSVRAMGSL
jgi:hypothetical protein